MKHELIETNDKKNDILNKIKETPIDKAILFSNKKRDIESFVKTLLENDFKAFALYNGVEEEEQEKIVKTFNTEEKVFIVCSDSIAKKVELSKPNFIIGTDLPTRANDYKLRLSYMNEEGQGFTFYNEENKDKLIDINKVMNNVSKSATSKEDNIVKKEVAKKATPKKESQKFGGHIPAFLQVDVSHLLKG